MSEREGVGGVICIVLCLLLFIGALKGCDTLSNTYQPPVCYTGQVTSIAVAPSGYYAEIVLETVDGEPKSYTLDFPLTVSQASSVKPGDMVALDVIFNNWGTFHHVQSIRKR